MIWEGRNKSTTTTTPNLGVNRMLNGDTTAASVKHKCYSFTIIMYYLNSGLPIGIAFVDIIQYHPSGLRSLCPEQQILIRPVQSTAF